MQYKISEYDPHEEIYWSIMKIMHKLDKEKRRIHSPFFINPYNDDFLLFFEIGRYEMYH